MTLKHRQQQSTPQAADFFSALEGLPYLSLGHDDLTVNESGDAFYQQWQAYIKISPTALYESLTKDLPEGTCCELVFMNHQTTLCVSHSYNEAEDVESDFFTYSRELTIDNKTLISTNADICISDKNKKIGRILQRNMIGTLRDIGYASLSGTSNDVGGYAWAKMGYVFNEAATSVTDKQQLVSVLRERLGHIQAYLPAEMAHIARKNIELCRKSDINALADLNFSLNPALKTIFEKQPIKAPDAFDNKLLRSALSFMHEMTNDYSTQDSQELWRNFNQCGQDYTLGKYLLLKTHWNSHLDFSDNKQMKRVESYLGL
jgi:hypothetical protein